MKTSEVDAFATQVWAVGEKENVAKHLSKARTDIESLKKEHAAEVVVMEKS